MCMAQHIFPLPSSPGQVKLPSRQVDFGIVFFMSYLMCIEKCKIWNSGKWKFLMRRAVTLHTDTYIYVGYFLETSDKTSYCNRKASEPQDLYLELFDHSEIWHSLQQHCCRGACQIAKWCDDLNYYSCSLETSWDLMIRQSYWILKGDPGGHCWSYYPGWCPFVIVNPCSSFEVQIPINGHPISKWVSLNW